MVCVCWWSITVKTHWGRVTHICVSKVTIFGTDIGLSPDRHQAIIWTNAGILLIRTLKTNFSEILDEIHLFSFKKMHLKMSSAKGRLFGLGLNQLIAMTSQGAVSGQLRIPYILAQRWRFQNYKCVFTLCIINNVAYLQLISLGYLCNIRVEPTTNCNSNETYVILFQIYSCITY